MMIKKKMVMYSHVRTTLMLRVIQFYFPFITSTALTFIENPSDIIFLDLNQWKHKHPQIEYHLEKNTR